jgi:hypothetical protein
VTERDARRLAVALMKEHGLDPMVWTFKIDRRSRRRSGHCRFRWHRSWSGDIVVDEGQLSLAAWLIRHNEEPRVRNTILHEIAHALTPGCHHDWTWQRVAERIGCDGLRCYDADSDSPLGRIQRPALPWQGTCPGGHKHERVRAPRMNRTSSCGLCVPGRFSAEHIVTWRKTS